ncbi:unnamed protein product [Cercopithifilaria johnstoni]|uniref:Nucleotide exchange factor Fes1 domain-containing protein n=1 Tax=Cercopithifilaria johnstoni TaxID=2874296 RepID=A0A8J2QAU5_9BILA|nr:unnamed protein product [Cercopithifilaria johnstoni]
MGEQNTASLQCLSKLLCLAQSANVESSGEANQLLSKQDQKFIENAVAEAMHLADPVKHLSKNIEQLKLIAKTEDDVTSIKQIVDNLEELVCDMDCAADFCKLGGLVEVIRFLKSDSDSVRCEIARLIPLLAQNNPNVQDIILETDLLPYLLNVLEEINASEELLMKALSSLSSIIRAHEKAFSQFHQLKGLERIENVFQKAVNVHQFNLANKIILITTSIALSLGSDVKQYNILPILLRMTLQLTSDSTGCSYFFEYVMNNIMDKAVDNNDLESDGFKINFMELDNQSKQHFRDFLKRQMNYEKQLSYEDPDEMNMVLDEKCQAGNFEDIK